MTKRVVGVLLLAGFLLVNGLGLAMRVQAQAGGPASGAIQLALRSFLATVHTWTGAQTWSGAQTFKNDSYWFTFRAGSSNNLLGQEGAAGWGDGYGQLLYGWDQSATPTSPAMTVGAFANVMTTWPAMALYVQKTNFNIVGMTDQVLWFCDETGVTPCDNPIFKLTGNGAITQLVYNTSGSLAGIGTADVVGHALNNPVAATVGATVQRSPILTLDGSAWNSGGGAAETDRWALENVPVTVAGTTTSSLLFRYTINSLTSWNTAMTLTSGGLLSGPTYGSAGSGMAVANVGANSCGTTAASIAGNNNAFVITVGATSGTQCRVAFTVTAGTEWDCAANDDTTTVAVRTTPVDTTHTDLIGAFTAGDKVTGICFPR